MPSLIRVVPVDATAVKRATAAVLSGDDVEQIGRVLGLLSDPVRVRVLFALLAANELCVGDVAIALEISMDRASYALKLLRTAGLVQARRDGRTINYRLADAFPHQLLEHCLGQLLAISRKEDMHASH